ncbi:DMT family transporter [Thiomicrorhabdus sp. ZW0627]|uniref:DMT family transporter n=1 Tax=Thiomicrorhabdus sp. ZW0627 TaxID=3039774 RepID=UPI0024365488|nr:DMT family transporter [Thiomicrorhabdus sp. ZW0627]MDG6774493.1 DMT family transporter [Thiomicrorhabdus sp. ZW0627]
MAFFKHASPRTIGFLLAIFGTALFSIKSIFIKLTYAEGLDTDSVLMLRMAIALPIYLLIMVWLVRVKTTTPLLSGNLIKITLLGFIGYYLSSLLDLKGLEMISAQLERLTLFTYPIMVALLGALFFKTPLTRKILLALVVTYGGLWVSFHQELQFSGENTSVGTLLVFLAALTFSFYVLFGKKLIHEVGSLWFTSLAMAISSGFVLIHYVVFNDFSNLNVSAMAWLWLFLLAIFSTVIPSFMISEAIAKIGPAQTGIIGTLGPLVTIVLAVWILNEPFSIWHAFGLVLVVGGVTILTYQPKPK